MPLMLSLPLAHAGGSQLSPDLYGAVLLELAAVGAYLVAAQRPSPRGKRWSAWRTASFVGGMTVVATALHSDVASYDGVFAVHISQHLVLMMLAAPLLAAGAPITLALRTLGTRGRRRLVGVLQDPAMRPLSGRAAAILVPLDFYGSMVIYLLTPLYALSLDYEAAHIAAHAYFLSCGLLFWAPMLGVDPVRWRPRPKTARLLVACGFPASALLTAALLTLPAPVDGVSPSATHAGAWALLFAGSVLTVVDLALLRAVRPIRGRADERAAGSRASQDSDTTALRPVERRSGMTGPMARRS